MGSTNARSIGPEVNGLGVAIMVGLMRGLGMALTYLLLLAAAKWAEGSPALPPPGVPSIAPAAQDKPAGTSARAQAQAQSQGKPDVSSLFSQPGDEPPRPFVPLHARTVDDRQRSEAVRLYTAARRSRTRKRSATPWPCCSKRRSSILNLWRLRAV